MNVKMISCCCVVFASCLFSSASAANYIGVILEGYEKDCIVQSEGATYNCGESRRLYAGDKVIKKPSVKALQVKWAPYAGGREQDQTTLLVIFEPPKDKKGILQGVREVLGLLKTGHSVSVGATRGRRGVDVPQPGNNATLIPGYRTTFVWESDGGEFIVFHDAKGTEVYKKDLRGASSVSISPEEIGMKPGRLYTWSVSGTGSNKPLSVLRLLANDAAQQIAADVEQINKEAISAVERALKKATYLQFVSDAYPSDMDLYWLSYLILEELGDKGVPGEEDKALVDKLKGNYLRHVRQTM
jgi:hypothetical protein